MGEEAAGWTLWHACYDKIVVLGRYEFYLRAWAPGGGSSMGDPSSWAGWIQVRNHKTKAQLFQLHSCNREYTSMRGKTRSEFARRAMQLAQARLVEWEKMIA